MYLCEICSTPFDEPLRRTTSIIDDERMSTFVEVLCPVCTSPYFTESDPCPKCSEWKPTQALLCRDCRSDLLRRFTAFADELTAEEEEQLDDWLDGDSITNRRQWT